MAKKKNETALVVSPDPEKFASDLEDLETLAQKVTVSEVKAKRAHDFIRRYRRWRNGMLKMEAEFWAEAATLVDEPKPPVEAEPEAE